MSQQLEDCVPNCPKKFRDRLKNEKAKVGWSRFSLTVGEDGSLQQFTERLHLGLQTGYDWLSARQGIVLRLSEKLFHLDGHRRHDIAIVIS